MITAQGLTQLGYTPEVDFSLQNDGGDTYIKSWWSDDAPRLYICITTIIL